MPESIGPQRIPRARFDWLSRESERWREAGFIDDTRQAHLLACYEPEAAHARGMTALVVLAALMVGIGVLLLIGYNWDRLGPWTKVAITMSGVAVLFAGSAAASARRHNLAAETLALIGTFAFSNSIWLIAQVSHIQGHFPDAFMWSTIVRWTSVIENMLWSGLMLLAAGGGLLLIARLWRHRDRTFAIAGRLS